MTALNGFQKYIELGNKRGLLKEEGTMSPYKIDMCVVDYTKDKEPLYKVKVYDKNDNIILSSNKVSKETAVKNIADYCCVSI